MAKTQSPSSLMFKVNRFSSELIVPAKPTPHEFKVLSDVDNSLRFQIPSLFIYAYNPAMNGVDLVGMVKNTISQALVYYYPLAGRLRGDPSGKLMVECTGEGVLFIEAGADVTLDQFAYPPTPTFMCYEELIFSVPSSSDILNSPLILIQVTRLKCGSLIIGTQFNHCMCDAVGFLQFVYAITEMAKGATALSVLPTWERHILNSDNPQHWRSSVSENQNNALIDNKDMCYRTFLFGKTEISALRRHIPSGFQRFSLFELLISCFWKCRVLALASTGEEIVSLYWQINLRQKSNLSKVPAGYYGNALVYVRVKSNAKEIIRNPLTYTLQLVTNGKDIVPINSDLSVFSLDASKSYAISDLRFAGFQEVDFGCGKPVYGGPAVCRPNLGYLLTFIHKNGEKSLLLPTCLPTKQMEIFERELYNIFKKEQGFVNGTHISSQL